MTGAMSADRRAVQEWFETLYGSAPGLIHVCARDNWTGKTFTDPREAAAYAITQDFREGVYARCTTIREAPAIGKRGDADQSVALVGLWADLDLDGPGHKPPLKGLALLPDEAAARAVVAHLPEPTLWVHSGGGLYPWWLLDEPHVLTDDLDDIAALSYAWHESIVQVAAERGWHVGNTGDLARVLRVAGGVNRKEGLERRCRVLRDGGPRYSLAALRDVVAQLPASTKMQTAPPASRAEAQPESDVTRFLFGSHGESPFDVFADTVEWGDLFEPAGYTHEGEDSKGRELWLREGSTAAYSLKAGEQVAVVHSDATGLPYGKGQRLTRGRVFAHLHHDGDESAAARDLLAAAHGDATATEAARGLPERVLTALRERCVKPAQTSETDAPADDTTEAPSWAPVDLTAVLDGSYAPPTPTLLTRTDGVSLLYPGLTHSFHGESESGKSLLLQIEAARLVAAGEDVLFIDFESDEVSVAERLLTFGAPAPEILKHFHYVRPQSDPRKIPAELQEWEALLSRSYALAVIDGVTDALGVFGYKTKENDDITAWARACPRLIADRTGAAVAVIDHVTKDPESRNRFALGGQAKMNGLTGAAYMVEIAEPLGLGLRGVIVLRIAKDRPGGVRSHCGVYKKSERSQEAARITIDARGEVPVVTIAPPNFAGAAGSTGEARPFRPTVLMERAAHAIELDPGLTKNAICDTVGGNRRFASMAVDLLVEEGYVKREAGSNNSQRHTLVRPYRRALDPLDDEHGGGSGTTGGAKPVVSGSSPYTGGLGTTHSVVPEPPAEPLGTTGSEAPFSPAEVVCSRCSGRGEHARYDRDGGSVCAECAAA